MVRHDFSHCPPDVFGCRVATDGRELSVDPYIAEIPICEREAHRGIELQHIEQSQSLQRKALETSWLELSTSSTAHAYKVPEAPVEGILETGKSLSDSGSSLSLTMLDQVR